MKSIIVFALTLAMLTPFKVMAQNFVLTPANTSIQFRIKNMGVMNVKGSFEKFKGTLELDEADITKSKVDVSIDVASIKTGIERRDNHLRSADFFDAARFPGMKFSSTAIETVAAEKLKLIGNLTIKDISKPVILTVAGQSNQSGIDFVRSATATATINRKDFGITWGAVIGDDVYITITTRLDKASATEKAAPLAPKGEEKK